MNDVTPKPSCSQPTLEPNGVQPKSRIQWLDAARAFAIITVVLCHVDEKAYAFFEPEAMVDFGIVSEVFGVLLFIIARLGVPFFLFLTGYLMLTRHYDGEGCRKFWKTRWLPLFGCIEAWIAIYTLFLGTTMGQPLTVDVFVRNMLFLQQVSINHIWYLPMILGFYLFVPVMAMALERLDPRDLRFPLVVLILIEFVVPVASPVVEAFGEPAITSVIHVGFSGGMCGIYLILGWAVARGAFKPLRSTMLGLVSACSALALLLMELWLFSMGVSYFLWYSNVFVLLCALSLFELFSRIKGELPGGRAIRFVSKYSFAVYLTHYPIFMKMWPHFLEFPMSTPVRVLAATAVLFILSLLASFLISKIPFIGGPLLYQRRKR